MRTDAINTALERTLSRERLDKYLLEKNGNIDLALTLYERNTKLSESFYTSLQSLEICLRNTLDLCMRNVYGADWFQNGNAPLNNLAKSMIEDAYREIKKQPPVPNGDVVAELKFSFWVALLGPGYDATIWRKALHQGFRKGGGKRRSDVHNRFNALRRFRNRVAHHEPIFDRDLVKTHSEIIEGIGWMCPDTQAWAAFQSRTLAVIQAA